MALDSVIDQFYSLVKKVNKPDPGSSMEESKQGIVSGSLPELELDLKDEEIISLTKKWLNIWDSSNVKNEWVRVCEENEKYWLGKQYGKSEAGTRPIVDNLIFESLEEFLPQATRRNPEPVVLTVDEKDPKKDEVSKEYAKKIKDRLVEITDRIKLRLKIKRATRYWSLFLVGVAKIGWSVNDDDVSVRIIRPHKMIFDPNGVLDEDGYSGRWLGEYRKMEASVLARILPDKKKKIDEFVSGEMGTEIQFIEWWTDEYTCWTLKDEVLLKKKNPNWNYDKEGTLPKVDEQGNVGAPEAVKGVNHFKHPQKPYVFISVFNLGKKPVDDTSLITQNLPIQDLVNKRNRQIDKNADNNNGGMVVSLERSGLTKDQAKNVTDALRRGGVVSIPAGAPRDAVDRFQGSNLPSEIFSQLGDMRTRLRDIFGVKGSSPSGMANQRTIRGQMAIKQMDAERIGGGVTEYLEQFADDIFNHIVQIQYVYYSELQQLFVGGFQPPKLSVSIKEGSLLPKDTMSLAHQAIDLANAGKMSLIDMYKRLEYPNPEELAANVWLERNAPELLFKNSPLVQQVLQGRQQQQQMQSQGQIPSGIPLPAQAPHSIGPPPTKVPPLRQMAQDRIPRIPPVR